ncbi:hypothetical protein [uncultured Rubinisphaera sp.]|uniref:hypothetical protein n=1 Tax=uncultured Rubinisphaera sp. TaxID=1678686 RepID=UPI0030DC6D70
MTMFIAATIPAVVVGDYARLLNWATFAAPYLSLGLTPYFTRELGKRSQDEAQIIIYQGARQVIILAVMATILLGIAVMLEKFRGPGMSTQAIYSLSISSLIAGSLLIGGMFRGLGLPLWAELPMYLIAPSIMSIGILSLWPQTVGELFLVFCTAQLFAFLMLAVRLAKYSNWHYEKVPGPRLSIVLLISIASTSLVTAGQLALAGILFDSRSMANLHLGYVFANSINLAFSSILAVHQKDISRAHHNDGARDLQNTLNNINKALFSIGAPLFLALALAVPVVQAFLPEGYDDFTTIAFLFLIGQVFNFVGGPSAMFFLMVGGEKYLNYTLMTSAVAGLSLAYLSAGFSMEAFVGCLALMTLAWNFTLVYLARLRYGVHLHVFSFLLK